MGEGCPEQLGKQAIAVGGTVLYSGIMSLIILLVLDKIPGLGLRASKADEDIGLDLGAHGEVATVRDGAD